MVLRYQTSRSNFGTLQSYLSSTCTNSYFKFKQEIEQEIEELYKVRHDDFCRRCGKIKQRINEKDSEFKKCYVDISRPLKLIENNDIIRTFINDCPKLPQCIRNRQFHVKKNDVPKQSKEDQCKGKSPCEKVTAPKEGAGGKPQPAFVAESSGRRSTQNQGLLSKVTGHVEEKSRDARVTLQGQNGITSPDNSDRMHVVAPDPKVDNHFSTSEQAETISKHISALAPSATTESNGLPSDSSQQNSSTGESGSISKSEEKVLDKNSVQSGPSGGQNVQSNPSGAHNLGSNTSEGHDGRVTVLVPSISVTEAPRERAVDGQDFIPPNRNDRDSVLASADDISNSSEDPGDVTSAISKLNNGGVDDSKHPDDGAIKGSTKSECDNSKSVSGDVPCTEASRGKTCNTDSVLHTSVHSVTVPIADSSPVKGHVETIEVNSFEAEKMTQKLTCNHIAQNAECGTYNGEHSNLANGLFQQEENISDLGNPLRSQTDINVQPAVDYRVPTGDNYNVNEISENNDCTPLGTLFTKKKRNKRKDMDEKLQRVLSEPSVTRERSVPFSYSAFEYST
ncbi:unnamed protein product [Plasmodium vivax]|uniref:(malaria parasite P. vivax) hypothetical protein n=1 Tax=Plasmodium vivax TaxID=5855 RepID=A0A8S4HDA8_PLAVI|nr:unnamed protein product [Plasmodium vivax]